MAIYEYRCIDCAAVEQRLGGLQDYVAICARCAGIMLRFDEETINKISDFLHTAQIFHRKFPGREIFSQLRLKGFRRLNETPGFP